MDNKAAVFTWIGLFIQVVLVIFGVGIVVTYLNSVVMSGWVGVSGTADVVYCRYLLFNLLSDVYVREGHELGVLDSNFRQDYKKNIAFFKNFNELSDEMPLNQQKYSPYGLNLGSDYLIFSKQVVMTVAPEWKYRYITGRPFGNIMCGGTFYSPAGYPGKAEVSYEN